MLKVRAPQLSFDLIIIGSGAAGLSVIRQLGLQGLQHLRVLLIDRAPKLANDRTWCFWEQATGPFEEVVHRRWSRFHVHDGRVGRHFSIRPYTYKMIRSDDLYRFMDDHIERCPSIVRLYGEVSRVEDGPDGATVHVAGEAYTGRWVLSSLISRSAAQRGYISLMQHFQGWTVEVPKPTFDPGTATFMDFRVPHHNDVRFVYVLPLDSRRALVEFTVFSRTVLTRGEYACGLHRYLQEVVGLEEYLVTDSEWGVIPMTDAPFPTRLSRHVMAIGTAGGCTKPSTGFTFGRIQRQARSIVSHLARTGDPFAPPNMSHRHIWMDSIFLRVLETGRVDGRKLFGDLFALNPASRVLRFLSEESTFAQDLALITTMDMPRFTATALEVTAKQIYRALQSKRRL